jgi:hypothetical protein
LRVNTSEVTDEDSGCEEVDEDVDAAVQEAAHYM